MLIENNIDNRFIKLAELAHGEFFRYSGDLYQKMDEDAVYIQTHNLSEAQSQKLAYNTIVEPVNITTGVIEEDDIVTFDDLKVGETFAIYIAPKDTLCKFGGHIFIKSLNHIKEYGNEYNAFNLTNNNIFTIDESYRFRRVNAKVVIE